MDKFDVKNGKKIDKGYSCEKFFRLVQVGKGDVTNGYNLMFGKTFIRSFCWSNLDYANHICYEMNLLIKADSQRQAKTQSLLIVSETKAKKDKTSQWVNPPKNNYLG